MPDTEDAEPNETQDGEEKGDESDEAPISVPEGVNVIDLAEITEKKGKALWFRMMLRLL